ncbi:hypothetical protein [Bradyrhizobium sp. NAS80.1]|uniref:hypothetical protein n=1 Tax=Bradyrhizobium sp. NAS80.1 TaxID=1680159 RepID=UPI0011610317|nr:hypothetical protein [Bradyrhizobium sp. NAS80.1]
MKKLLITLASTIALSSGADVQISMPPGSQCWSYQGRDTRFYGNFLGGQALTVAVVEQQSTEHAGMKAIAYNGEQVWVNGPNGYFRDGNRESNPNDPFIHTDKPGRYIFNLYEHGTGTEFPVFVKICAMRKDQAKTK